MVSLIALGVALIGLLIGLYNFWQSRDRALIEARVEASMQLNELQSASAELNSKLLAAGEEMIRFAARTGMEEVAEVHFDYAEMIAQASGVNRQLHSLAADLSKSKDIKRLVKIRPALAAIGQGLSEITTGADRMLRVLKEDSE